jgi:hypothetical protein
LECFKGLNKIIYDPSVVHFNLKTKDNLTLCHSPQSSKEKKVQKLTSSEKILSEN